MGGERKGRRIPRLVHDGRKGKKALNYPLSHEKGLLPRHLIRRKKGKKGKEGKKRRLEI